MISPGASISISASADVRCRHHTKGAPYMLAEADSHATSRDPATATTPGSSNCPMHKELGSGLGVGVHQHHDFEAEKCRSVAGL